MGRQITLVKWRVLQRYLNIVLQLAETQIHSSSTETGNHACKTRYPEADKLEGGTMTHAQSTSGRDVVLDFYGVPCCIAIPVKHASSLVKCLRNSNPLQASWRQLAKDMTQMTRPRSNTGVMGSIAFTVYSPAFMLAVDQPATPHRNGNHENPPRHQQDYSQDDLYSTKQQLHIHSSLLRN